MNGSQHDRREGVAEPVGQPIVITINGPAATVDARQSERVATILQSERIDWGGAAGTVTGRVVRQWHGRRTGTTYTFPAKLALTVGARLLAVGITTLLRGLRPRQPAGWDAAPVGVRDLLGNRQQAGLGGLIPCPCGHDARDIIPAIIRMYPGVRVAVVVRNRNDVQVWRRQLSTTCGGRRVVLAGDEEQVWRGRDAVVVCSLFALDRFLRAEDFDVVVVTDVAPILARPLHAATARGGLRSIPANQIMRDPAVPAFGFLYAPLERLSAAERLTLLSSFTHVLGGRPRVGPRVRVSVAAVPATAGVPDELLAAKRAVWADAGRNDRITQIAVEAAACPQRRVAVLVGSPAHAADLAGRLNGWVVVTGAADAALPDRAIVTEGWLARGHRLDAEVVVDARGWGPLRPDDLTDDGEVTVVDVPAGGHPEFRRRAGMRRATYTGYGWMTNGSNAKIDGS